MEMGMSEECFSCHCALDGDQQYLWDNPDQAQAMEEGRRLTQSMINALAQSYPERFDGQGS